MSVIEIKEYIDQEGLSPYARWFDRLDARAAARVTTTLIRMEHGNLSCAKGAGGGIILLGGGTKKRQQRDIETARSLWREYNQRKRRET